MRDFNDGAAEKLGDLLGSRTVANGAKTSQEKSLSACGEMEAGVGIEPAYTDLQTFPAQKWQQCPTIGSKYIKGLQQPQQWA